MQLQAQLENGVALSLSGFEQAVVWDSLNIELGLYVSIYISGAVSMPGTTKELLNHIQFIRIISWIVFSSPPKPSISLNSLQRATSYLWELLRATRACFPHFFRNFVHCQTKKKELTYLYLCQWKGAIILPFVPGWVEAAGEWVAGVVGFWWQIKQQSFS